MSDELKALVPTSTLFDAPAVAGFMDGTDGTMRTTWRRSHEAPLGHGWDAFAGSPYVIGDTQSRERTVAAAVANDLATSNPMIATIIETLATNTLGTGLTLSSKPDVATLGISAEMGRQISHLFETAWRAWASNPLECDLSGRFNVDQLANCFFKTWLRSGEGLAALDWKRVRGAKTKTKICLLDPRQIDGTVSFLSDGGAVLAGVAFDRDRRLTGFMIRDVPIATFGAARARFVPAFTSWGKPRIIHAFELLDARQVRGISPIVAALTPANEKESLAEFAVVNALVQTQFAVTVESDLSPAYALGGLKEREANEPQINSDILNFLTARGAYYGAREVKMGPGVVNYLPLGDKLRLNKAASTGENLASFDQSLTRSGARAAGAMVEEISGDYSKTSFSASRLAQELPYRITLRRRKMIVERFYASSYAALIDEAVTSGIVKLPDGAPDYLEFREAYLAAKWLGVGRAEPDRKKAAEAVTLELEMGLITFEDALAERGTDLETHLEAIKSERALMREAGLDKSFFPGSVTTQNRNEIIEEESDEGSNDRKEEDDDALR